MNEENKTVPRHTLVGLIKREVEDASAGDLMDICDMFGYEFVMIRPNVFELKTETE